MLPLKKKTILKIFIVIRLANVSAKTIPHDIFNQWPSTLLPFGYTSEACVPTGLLVIWPSLKFNWIEKDSLSDVGQIEPKLNV